MESDSKVNETRCCENCTKVCNFKSLTFKRKERVIVCR